MKKKQYLTLKKLDYEKAVYCQLPKENGGLIDDLIIERLTSRRVCSSCGTIYNTRNHNPKVAGICDECGAPVIQRKDDSVESIKNRLMVYSKNTKPLIDYYNKKNLMYVVDGVADSPVVFSEICGILNAQNN